MVNYGRRHNDVVEEIKSKFENKYSVSIRNNNLPKPPTRGESVYRPDIIFRDRKNDEITHIIEVETSDRGGKSVVGATILADYCIGVHMKNNIQKNKPQLIFVFLGKSPRIELANKRIDRIGGYLKYLKGPKTFSYPKFMKIPEV